MRMIFWVGLSAFFWLVAGGVIAVVMAAPPAGSDPDSETAQWFRGLMQPGTNMSCCDLSDCRHNPVRVTSHGYQAYLEGEWIDVPSDKILPHKENPTGEPVVCAIGKQILCFIEGAGT